MLHGHRRSRSTKAQTLALLGRNGTGKTTLINTLAGATRQHRRHDRAGRRGAAQAAAAPARRGRHRLGAAGAQHLQVAHGAREPDGGGAARAVDAGARLRDVPAPGASARATWARSCPAASSRCWRWAARWSSIRGCCCSTSRSEGLAPIIVEELLRAIRRITREEGLSAIIVEQHPQAILGDLRRGGGAGPRRVVHAGPSDALRADPAILERFLGVSKRGVALPPAAA